jgi:hypothetical protein
MPTTARPLLELLASYDQEVEAALAEALDASTGTEQVQLLYRLRHVISVHDSVLTGVLCPLLIDLPQGHAVAERLREGCTERNKALRSFQALTKGVAAHNVSSVQGEELEPILDALQASFRRHADVETVEVAQVLESAGTSNDPDVLAARMALEVRRSPTFAHRRSHRSALSKTLYRYIDSHRERVDARHGWRYAPAGHRDGQGTTAAAPPGTEVEERWVPKEPDPVPRGLAPTPLRRRVWDEIRPRPPWLSAPGTIPSIGDVLASYDRAVDKIIDELRAARTVGQRVESLSRFQVAISIHDSVLSGTLCPLLRSLSGGVALADRYLDGTKRRAELLEKLNELMTARPNAVEAYREQADTVEENVEELLASFRLHEGEESASVTEFLNSLPKAPVTSNDLTTASGDRVGAWPSSDPATIATVMALYAERAPTRNR